MNILLANIKYGFRTLHNAWVFSLAAILTLAVGIGVNTTVFSIVHAVLLKPLPYRNSDRLVMLWETAPNSSQTVPIAPANSNDFSKQTDLFQQLTLFKRDSFNLSGWAEPIHVQISVVSPNFFDFFQVAAQHGHTFHNSEGEPGKDRVIVLNHSFWRQYFGANDAILDKVIRLDGVPYQIIGVAQSSFLYPTPEAAGWIPSTFHATSSELRWRGSHFLQAIGELKPGVTLQSAEARLSALAAQLGRQYPITNKGWGVKLVDFQQELSGEFQAPLLLLLAAVVLVLLIGCANIATLLLSRATVREREISLRIALGASRRQIVQQLLIEAMLLSLVGGMLGYLLTVSCMGITTRLLPLDFSLFGGIHPDIKVALFCFLLSCVTGVVFGLTPALQAGKTAPYETLKSARAPGSTGFHRAQSIFIIGQFSLALILVTGAGLSIRSLFGLVHTDPGFNSQNLLTMAVSLPQAVYRKSDEIDNFYRQTLNVVHDLHGVEDVALVSNLPMGRRHSTNVFAFENSSDSHFAHYFVVSPTYFHTMQIPVRSGRSFGYEDVPGSPLVVMVNEAFVRTFLGTHDALQNRIKLVPPDEEGPWREIVGVVSDVRDTALEKPSQPAVYLPLEQDLPQALDMNIVVRTNPQQFGAVITALKREMQNIDREEPVFEIMPMQQVLQNTLATRALVMALLMAFAGASVLLAAIGVFGVMSYLVSQRAAEIGIRMALGADRRSISYFILRRSMRMAAVGLTVGAAVSAVLVRFSTAYFSTIHPLDPLAWCGSTATLLIVGFIASYLPARRAANLDPAIVLRSQ